MPGGSKLRVAFIHPDLGIGGAERLVVDAALGLQNLGHDIDIYTSHHDPGHCFEETRDGSLRVHHVAPPLPRSLRGKLHIFFAHLRQLHLTLHLLLTAAASRQDVFFVDQLATCVPILRLLAGKRVVFYCHFPDKLLADGEFLEGVAAVRRRKQVGLLKRAYRFPMDWLEEMTTGQADIILANSQFTSRVFKANFTIPRTPKVVYPGINITAYEAKPDLNDADVQGVISNRPTFLSLNRFEKKKNAALAVEAFAIFRRKWAGAQSDARLVIAGGYDPRVHDNIETLRGLIAVANAQSLSYHITGPGGTVPTDTPSTSQPATADILFLLNFSTAQRSALLQSPHTRALLYTPAGEHFGIGPVEGMACGLPVIACNSGGPTETVVAHPPAERTGWLLERAPEAWAEALWTTAELGEAERAALRKRASARAREFGMEAMARGLEEALCEAVAMGPVKRGWVAYFVAALGVLFLALGLGSTFS